MRGQAGLDPLFELILSSVFPMLLPPRPNLGQMLSSLFFSASTPLTSLSLSINRGSKPNLLLHVRLLSSDLLELRSRLFGAALLSCATS